VALVYPQYFSTASRSSTLDENAFRVVEVCLASMASVQVSRQFRHTRFFSINDLTSKCDKMEGKSSSGSELQSRRWAAGFRRLRLASFIVSCSSSVALDYIVQTLSCTTIGLLRIVVVVVVVWTRSSGSSLVGYSTEYFVQQPIDKSTTRASLASSRTTRIVER
jgi:hypothetical protein